MPRLISSGMLVGDVATRNAVCIDRNATILMASTLMRVYQVEDLVVTDQRDGKLMLGGSSPLATSSHASSLRSSTRLC
jgi:hypothetical protein